MHISACLKLTYFTDIWKEATILAFHKPGKDEKNPTSYKPISLLSTFSKILEIIIPNRLKYEDEPELEINDCQ